jgi:hypothetical protein
VIFCLAAATAMLPHLNLWPRIAQDEVQILDLGRTALNPVTDWSMGWLVEESRPRSAGRISMVALQELAFALTAPSNFGPRFFSLLGAILAATAALGWLLARSSPPLAALLLASAFLLDPLFNESYRQARVDSWAFVFVLSACWLLQATRGPMPSAQRRWWLLFVAGLFAGSAPSVWKTSYALMPLVALEFFYVLQAVWRRAAERPLSRVLSNGAGFVAGGAIAFVSLHAGVFLNWASYLTNLQRDFRVQSAGVVTSRNIFDMYFLYDPIIVLAVVASLLIRRELGLFLALAVSLLMMYQTMMYPMRILYLLPYFAAIIGGACAVIASGREKPRRKAILIGTLALLISWNAGVSLVKRPLIAYFQQDARSPDHIREVLEDAIGVGPYRVLLEEWDMYYAARSLGWKSYKVYGPLRRRSPKFREFLKGMDYVIQRNNYQHLVSSEELLEAAGFRQVSTLSFMQPSITEISLGPFKVRAPNSVYDDAVVYQRVAK